MSERAKAVSMADVAEVAGVSHQTVSRVINAPDKVREETRQRVEDAIRELGFRPNLAARALVRGTAGALIGAVWPGEALFGPSNLLSAINAAARGIDRTTVVSTIAGPGAVTEVAERFISLGAEGVVFVATGPDSAQLALRMSEHLPVCVVAAGFRDKRVSTVSVDQAAGARMALDHLISQGRRCVAHIAGPPDWFDAIERRAAWVDLTTTAEVMGPEVAGGWTSAEGYAALPALLAADPLPDAVLCANDQVALGLMHALAERGIRVPDDVAVIGYDAVDGSEHFQPSLTTVRQPFAAVGARAVEAVRDLVAGGPTVREMFGPELVLRGSA